DISRVASQVAHGALMGARGNSGVILSQIFRGFSTGVGDRVSVDCREMAHAFAEATTVAYKGVTKPTEGPILTVARAASYAALRQVGAQALEMPEEGWGFCTEFLIEAPAKPFEQVREELTAMGDSCVIVGDDTLVRVHIHTLDPGRLIAHATGYGALQKLKVE